MRPKTLLALCSLFLLALAILLYPSARIPAIHAQEGEKNQPEQQELAPPTNVVDHGLLSPEERKALMLSEGYSPESVEQYFELEAQLLRAASSPLPQQKLDQLTEKFEQDINALLRKDPPRIKVESPQLVR